MQVAMEFQKKSGVWLGSKLAITALALFVKGEVFSTGFVSILFSSLAIIL